MTDSPLSPVPRRIELSLLQGTPAPRSEPPASPCPWLPFVGHTHAEQFALLRSRLNELQASLVTATSEEEAAKRLKEIAEKETWQRVATHTGGASERCALSLGLPVWLSGRDDPAQLSQCPAAVTGCEALIAQTGSVLVTSRSSGGRALSVLPPHHIVVATRDQIVPDLLEAFSLLESRYGAQGYPSFVSLISGPSRTGDIERTLVLGAHGPRSLTILLIGQDLSDDPGR